MGKVKDTLLGLAVGDALGVPVEFRSREAIAADPVTGPRGYGTHRQPPGTWSDDSSLAFCLGEELIRGYDLAAIAHSFVRWLYEGAWRPHGEVFDIGIATREALVRLRQGLPPHASGGFDEWDNGNGSLMRVLPLLFHTRHLPEADRYRCAREVSAITHGHVRSVIACHYYLELARLLLEGAPKETAYRSLQTRVPDLLRTLCISEKEIAPFERLFSGNIAELPDTAIASSGYVVHTLEASVWCLLTTDNYADAVLRAVNLGSDTDTTGAVTGGLAGLLYGAASIPESWLAPLARRADIERLADDLERATQKLS